MKAGKPERARAALERIGSADYADRILREIAHTTERITIKSPMARCWLPGETDCDHWHGARHIPAVVWD